MNCYRFRQLPPVETPAKLKDQTMLWKRAFDIVLSIALLLVLAIPLFGIILYIKLQRDGDVFYLSERMKTPRQSFQLIKLRTMRPPKSAEENQGVSGGDKSNRITPFGAFLRRYRLDEIPQLLNVIKGDMSIVGPRPPLRMYTDMFPDLYQEVLAVKPSITGLASIVYHKCESSLLSQAQTPEETNEIYVRRCIPRKAKIDLLYKENMSISLDIYILYLTLSKFAPLPGRRARRVR